VAEKGVSKDLAKKAMRGVVITISSMDGGEEEMSKLKCPHCGKEFEPEAKAPMAEGIRRKENE